MPHDQRAIRNFHGDGEFLLDEQNGYAAFFQFLKVLTNQHHNLGRQTFSGLINDDEIGVTHECSAQG